MATDAFTDHPSYAGLDDAVRLALRRTLDGNDDRAKALFAFPELFELDDWRRLAFALVRIVVPAERMGLGVDASTAYHRSVKPVSLPTDEQLMHLAIGAAIHSGEAGLQQELTHWFGDGMKDAVRLLFLKALAVNHVQPDRIEALKEVLLPERPSLAPLRPELEFPAR